MSVFMEENLQWENSMIDRGIDRYLEQVERTKTKINKAGVRVTVHDESNTSYGVGLIKRYVDAVADVLTMRIKEALSGSGRSAVGYRYLASCDAQEAAYIGTKCIIDSLSRQESVAALSSRIGQRLQDQIRFATFQRHHPKYFKAVMDDMKRRKVNDYRHKRQVLVHVSGKASSLPEYQEGEREPMPKWIPWPIESKVHVGVALIDCFIRATSDYHCACQQDTGIPCYDITHRIPGSGMVEKVTVSESINSTRNYVVGTEKAIVWIKSNMSVASTLQPDYLPCLVKPKDWTAPAGAGYHSKKLQRTKPLVKTSRAHLNRLRNADLSKVYEAVNAAQNTAWQVDGFVLDQAIQEWKAPCGIGMPGNTKIEPPPCPLPVIEQGEMTLKQFRAYKRMLRESLTAAQKVAYSKWAEEARECYTKDRERISKILGLSRAIGVGQQLAGKEEFYYVNTLDYRGRMYAVGTGLNPQGTGLSKGLLKFKRGVPLGKHGYFHMCLHAAGSFGMDTGSLESRVKWVHDNKRMILRTGLNPEDTRDWWQNADKKKYYVFLAVCGELAQVWSQYPDVNVHNCRQKDLENTAAEYVSYLPAGQDGKCNGLQHFSAMLLDNFGAKAVNLKDNEELADIYNITLDVTLDYLKEVAGGTIPEAMPVSVFNGVPMDELSNLAQLLLDSKLDRSITKKSTMVVPYNGSKRTCLKDIHGCFIDLIEEKKKSDPSYVSPFESTTGKFSGVGGAALFLHHFVWSALDVTVVAARRAMKFVTGIAGVLAKHNHIFEWVTPSGFLVQQDIKNCRESTVKTWLSGKIKINLKTETDTQDRNRAKLASAPNYVHSMDASHLVLTVCKALDAGVEDFALVHDSFGVHFGNVERLHKCIRQAFVEIYSQDQLKKLLDYQLHLYPELAGEFPSIDLVKQGEFDIKEVLKSTHFFR